MENNSICESDLNLGDLIGLFYREFLILYGDEELASVAAAATINEILMDQYQSVSSVEEAA
jgi:hypothetical protein